MSAVAALRADARATTCALVDSATLRILGSPVSAPYDPGFHGAPDLVDRVLRSARHDGIPVAGLAFALPEGQSWRELGAALAERAGLPWVIQGVAHAAMRAEQLNGAASGRDSALLFDTDGLRIGLLLNRRPYDGANGSAGNVAHLGINRTGRMLCGCGRIGCLKALVDAGMGAPDAPLPGGTPAAPSRRHGWLAVAAISLVNTLNPQVLILESPAVESEPAFRWFADTVARACLAPTRTGLVDVARARADGALLGVASTFLATRPGDPGL